MRRPGTGCNRTESDPVYGRLNDLRSNVTESICDIFDIEKEEKKNSDLDLNSPCFDSWLVSSGQDPGIPVSFTHIEGVAKTYELVMRVSQKSSPSGAVYFMVSYVDQIPNKFLFLGGFF